MREPQSVYYGLGTKNSPVFTDVGWSKSRGENGVAAGAAPGKTGATPGVAAPEGLANTVSM